MNVRAPMSKPRSKRGLALAATAIAVSALAACAPRAVKPIGTPWTSPSVPLTCNTDDLASGNLVGCVLKYAIASSQGFGMPPFPATSGIPADTAVPIGWVWNGGAYNGSPILASWEQAMARNARAIGPVRANTIVAPPDVLPLYEGFLTDLANGGYTVREWGTYGFRCTSNSARRDCVGLAPDSLSLHAYGLAIDINWTANPERIYRSSPGVSACAMPMATDMPPWVVAAAQRWGLFWGGYGWSGRCPSPASDSDYVNRDVMHFEFRGTPQLARTISAWNASHPVPPAAQPAP